MNIPDNIYLQIGEDADLPLSAITWCADKINDNDIEYVRVQAYKRKLKSHLETWIEDNPDAEDEISNATIKDIIKILDI